jgi:uridine monophosphate synthetase
LKQYVEDHELEYDLICGVPYGAFAVATSLSLQAEKPMIYKRKEAKDYGCKKMVEGVFKPNEKCLVIEDVVVYGTSIIETSQVFFLLN